MKKDIVLITGGAGNIAKAITRKYLSSNCKVISVDIKNKNTTDAFNNNPNYEYYQIDVTNIEQIKKLKEEINNKYGKLTHLISAAGVPMKSENNKISDITIEDIDNSIKLNLNSHIYLTKILLPLLEKDESKNKTITIISSINAIKNFDFPIYSAGKAGIYGFIHAMINQLGQKNIRINAISPGSIFTQNGLKKGGKIVEQKKKMFALNNFTTPEDIADAIYSITHHMKALVGQNIIIDGGQTISTSY